MAFSNKRATVYGKCGVIVQPRVLQCDWMLGIFFIFYAAYIITPPSTAFVHVKSRGSGAGQPKAGKFQPIAWRPFQRRPQPQAVSSAMIRRFDEILELSDFKAFKVQIMHPSLLLMVSLPSILCIPAAKS